MKAKNKDDLQSCSRKQGTVIGAESGWKSYSKVLSKNQLASQNMFCAQSKIVSIEGINKALEFRKSE